MPSEPTIDAPESFEAPATLRREEHHRLVALFEVVLCSGVPTQLAIGHVLTITGFPPFAPDGTPRPFPLFALALTDTIVLLVLIALLLRAHGERLRRLLLGSRPALHEVVIGVLLVPALFIGVGLTVLGLRQALPWTHNVPLNPFEAMLQTPSDVGLFTVVAIVAGGLREEVQRAFLLHRFERSLGGPIVGLTVVSFGFGAGHVLQGWDAAIATGLLGLTWGAVFLRRRSAVAPIVSHAGYNAAQILQAVLVQGASL
jgi:membrane protease YdiL (CAAX protease family)